MKLVSVHPILITLPVFNQIVKTEWTGLVSQCSEELSDTVFILNIALIISDHWRSRRSKGGPLYLTYYGDRRNHKENRKKWKKYCIINYPFLMITLASENILKYLYEKLTAIRHLNTHNCNSKCETAITLL